MTTAPLPYRRVLLKISGEALAGTNPDKPSSHGLDQKMLTKIANDIAEVVKLGVQVAVVVGGGNIYRGVDGAKEYKIERATSDYMGMLATVINALALQSTLEFSGMESRVMTAIPMHAIGEMYIKRRAERHLEKSRVVIFAAGTGNPYFTTDTAASLRALEMNCDLLLKATKVDGVYDSDPLKNKQAKHHPHLSYNQVLANELNVMDATAVALIRENKLPLAVFSIYDTHGFKNVIHGKGKYTLVTHS